jgi:hypothetical protein
LIHENPAIYEFASPVVGTYPPSYDPSYWNEGRGWTWDARAQFRVIRIHLILYAGLFLRNQPGLLAAALTLILAGSAATRRALWRNWFLFALCFAALGLYMLIHVEVRYVGGFVAIFWLTILFGVRLSSPEFSGRNAEYLALAALVTIVLSVADGSVRAVRDDGPFSARNDVKVANQLEALGLTPGTEIALIGNGNWSYWARLGRYRIVSDMSAGAPAFWNGTKQQKESIYRLFASTGAQALVSTSPPMDAGEDWQRVGVSDCYVRWLTR